jgi:hypothetical protein
MSPQRRQGTGCGRRSLRACEANDGPAAGARCRKGLSSKRTIMAGLTEPAVRLSEAAAGPSLPR